VTPNQNQEDFDTTMSTEITTAPSVRWTGPAWKALIPSILFWAAIFATRPLELPYFYRFLFSMAAPALLLIVFSIWWWRNRNLPKSERAIFWLLLLGGAFIATPLLDKSAGVFTALTFGLPLVITLWSLWYVVSRESTAGTRRIGLTAGLLLVWGSLATIRNEGIDGDLKADIHWRWTPTKEAQFLAEHQSDSNRKTTASASPVVVIAGDWTGFRGPNADGTVRNLRIAVDWKKAPPKQLWKKRVGPAWSSVAVVGGKLFTQEQRGENEAVVCYDAVTGNELWAHEDKARFWEAVSGAGPRATPTFADGRIYTLGATGLLNCLDAADGKRIWIRDLVQDANAKTPMWGFSTTPLVTQGLVIVYGGGKNQNNLIAYRAETGSPAWMAKAGDQTYASPQLATIADKPQVLIISDFGLDSVDVANGNPLWHIGAEMSGTPRSLQPHPLEGGRVFMGSPAGSSPLGTSMVQAAPSGDGWKVEERWTTTQIKPEFSEFVVHGGHAYGFDGAIFCCIDLTDGKKLWKGGRYGRGQALLLVDQGLLLIVTEKGELALVRANPERHEELALLPGVEGKTWNHMAVAHGKLYVRNAEEMGCWQLPVVEK
jgi:outer membrane protein assembly factor BamB